MKHNSNIESLSYFASVLKDLNEVFRPHPGQVIVGRSFFYDCKENVFLQCGRKFGKTCFSIYSLYRFAMTFPGSSCYYFAPFFKQAREIVWEPGDIKNFLPPELRVKYGVKIDNGDFRIRFFNGSFIKVEGADNDIAAAGFNPHFVVLDEIKDIKRSFYDVFEPNLAAHGAPLLVVGSPPDNEDNLYCELAREARDDPNKAFFKMSTHKNPYISKEWLEKKKNDLIKRGDYHVWLREYMANIVVGGKHFIFPMLDEEVHCVDYDETVSNILAHRRSYDFYISFDPGTTSCFAALLVAINKYTKRVYLLDEIYEKDPKDAVTKKVWEKAVRKMNKICPELDDWIKIYDYAAAWFANEVAMEFDEALFPCTKDLKKKEMKLSLIKELLIGGNLLMTDRCPNIFHEMKNYRKDDKGRIPKENDHNIDNLRYILNTANYFSIPQKVRVVESDIRGYRIEDDIKNDGRDNLFYELLDEYTEVVV